MGRCRVVSRVLSRVLSRGGPEEANGMPEPLAAPPRAVGFPVLSIEVGRGLGAADDPELVRPQAIQPARTATRPKTAAVRSL